MQTYLRGTRRLLAATFLTAALAACNDTTSPFDQQSATFTLQTVNGNPLPFTFISGGSTISVLGDTYTLYANNTYTETTRETVSNGSQTSNVTQTETGTWFQDGTAVTFTPQSRTSGTLSPYTGALSNSNMVSGGVALTIAVNGVVSVYEEQ